ncbi:MAG: hypothetical protein ACREBW_05120 [Candidatus Micrarchaeaceae archaeon]
MSDGAPKPPEQWRNFTTRVPITACRLRHDGLKRLYQIVNEKQKEYRDKVVSRLSQMQEETLDKFLERKRLVEEAFVTSVTITGTNGERLTANNEKIFDDINLPTSLKSVFYSTQSVPKAVLKHLPEDRITVFLDFSQPSILDFSRLPTFPTPNESNFEIVANSDSWFSATKGKLTDFFSERRTGYDWIHRAGAYDILLFVVGLPLAVWASVNVGAALPNIASINILPRALVYSYVFLAVLFLYRAFFSYSRWVFPKVEIETHIGKTPLKHRSAWGVMLLAIIGPALYDLAHSIFVHFFL